MKSLIDEKYLIKNFDDDGIHDFHHYDIKNNEVTGRLRFSYNNKKCGYDCFVINNEDEGETISYDMKK